MTRQVKGAGAVDMTGSQLIKLELFAAHFQEEKNKVLRKALLKLLCSHILFAFYSEE